MAARFTRTARVAPGKAAEAHDLSVQLHAHFAEHYGLDMSWGYQWGGPTGVMYWWIDFDSLGHWEEVSMSMVADEGLGRLMTEGTTVWPDGAHDTIVRLE